MSKLSLMKIATLTLVVALCSGSTAYYVASKRLVTATWDEYRLCGREYIAIESETLLEAVKIRRVFQEFGRYADQDFHALKLIERKRQLTAVSKTGDILVEPIYGPLDALLARSPDNDGRWVTGILLSEHYRGTEDPISELVDNLDKIAWQSLNKHAFAEFVWPNFKRVTTFQNRMEVRTYDRKKFKDLYGVSCKKLEML